MTVLTWSLAWNTRGKWCATSANAWRRRRRSLKAMPATRPSLCPRAKSPPSSRRARAETARAIFGADPIQSGWIEVNGRRVRINSPQDAVAKGIGYLSEDRKRFGLAVNLCLRDNIVMASYDQFTRGLFVDAKKAEDVTEHYIERLRIKTPSVDQLIRNLSGGNQQKVVIAKWLICNCEILIFDEPTRGIDVGAKYEIYSLMEKMASEGKTIIMISSEMPELLGMSDRIAVMCEGHLSGILEGERATEENVMYLASSYKNAEKVLN